MTKKIVLIACIFSLVPAMALAYDTPSKRHADEIINDIRLEQNLKVEEPIVCEKVDGDTWDELGD